MLNKKREACLKFRESLSTKKFKQNHDIPGTTVEFFSENISIYYISHYNYKYIIIHGNLAKNKL